MLTLTSPEFRDILVMIFSIFIVSMWLMRIGVNSILIGSDDLYYFDTSSKNSDGEFKIMCYDLMNGIIYEYAPPFADFLEKLIGERI